MKLEPKELRAASVLWFERQAKLRRKDDAAVLGTDTQRVLDTLQACRGNRRTAARELGISERKMYRLLKRYEEMGITVPRPYQ